MKLKVTITGPKVHDIGYRHFLMISALNLGLSGFHACNRTDGVEQEVIALAEGDEEAIADFRRFVETRKPECSEVSNIAFENYEGYVMRAGEYAQVCTALQLNKAIPVLLELRDDMKAVKRNTDAVPQIREEIKGLREDVQPGFAVQFRQVQSDVRAIKERLGMH
jgi:acylphosphatase